MRIEVLYFSACPNYEALVARMRGMLEIAGVSEEIDLLEIADDRQARRERFLGSPTVRVDGRDIEPGAELRTDFGLKCRLYRTGSGLSGEPEDGLLGLALRRAAEGDPVTADTDQPLHARAAVLSSVPDGEVR